MRRIAAHHGEAQYRRRRDERSKLLAVEIRENGERVIEKGVLSREAPA